MAIKSAWDVIIRQEAKAVKVEMKSFASQNNRHQDRKYIIVAADDLGRSSSVNAAIDRQISQDSSHRRKDGAEAHVF